MGAYFSTNMSRGVLALVGLYLLNTASSTYYLLPNIYQYIGSYYHHLDNSITIRHTSFLAMFYSFCQAFLMVITILMHGKLGVRNTFFLINLFMFILIYASSYCKNLYWFSVLFSIGGSWTTGGYIYTGIKCLYSYFRKKNQKAIAGGVTISGQALISILTTNFALYYINPHNEPAENGEYFSK